MKSCCVKCIHTENLFQVVNKHNCVFFLPVLRQQLDFFATIPVKTQPCARHSSLSFPTFMWGRCFGLVAFKQPSQAPLRRIIPRLSRCCPSTSTSVFLLAVLFPGTSITISFNHILLLFSKGSGRGLVVKVLDSGL